jgi:hypothetical protein
MSEEGLGTDEEEDDEEQIDLDKCFSEWRRIVNEQLVTFCHPPRSVQVPLIVVLSDPNGEGKTPEETYRMWAITTEDPSKVSGHFLTICQMLFPDYMENMECRIRALTKSVRSLDDFGPIKSGQRAFVSPDAYERYTMLDIRSKRLLDDISDVNPKLFAFIAYERPEDGQWIIHGKPREEMDPPKLLNLSVAYTLLVTNKGVARLVP